jgi:hypothetical protein
MTDIRPRLNNRLRQLQQRLPDAEMWLDGGAQPGSQSYAWAKSWIEEIHQIEAILAQMQTADAQRALADAQHEVARAQRDATASSEADRAWNEGRAFWLRRFITSLAVAHGGAAFATISFLLRPEAPAASATQLATILVAFLGGLVTTGLTPLLLAWKPKEKEGDRLSSLVQGAAWTSIITAALLFAIGTKTVVEVGIGTFLRSQSQAASATATRAPSTTGPPATGPAQPAIKRP